MRPTSLDLPRSNRLRVRWAAIGAAIAVTLGAGTIATVDAVTSTGARPVYTAITPCRLIDTRPDPTINVGPKNTPLGPTSTETIAASGAQGQCSAAQLPTSAVALALNATALNATADGFLTFWPDGPRPVAASLNPSPGQPPAPNAVTTDLATDGTFRVYNENGTVDLVLDVIGYYTDHNHDDRYFRKTETYDQAEVDQLLAAAVEQAVAQGGTRRTILSVGARASNVDTSGDAVAVGTILGSFQKVEAGTAVRISTSTSVSRSAPATCIFQLRVNGATPDGTTGPGLGIDGSVARLADTTGPVPATLDSVFQGLPAGSHTVRLFIEQNGAGACNFNPLGFPGNVIIEELRTR